MGFGILFLGYLFFFNFLYGGFTDIFGGLILLYALSLLRVYNKGFKRAFYSVIPYTVYGGCAFVFQLLSLFGVVASTETTTFWFGTVGTVLRFILIWFILTGVRDIAKETEVNHILYRAVRNRWFTVLFYGCWLFLSLYNGAVTEKNQAFLTGFSIALLVVGLVFHFLVSKLIFSCYIWICLEGDEEMERGQSKNPIVNFINRRTDKWEDKLVEQKRQEAEEKAKKKAEKDRLHPHKQRKNEKKH